MTVAAIEAGSRKLQAAIKPAGAYPNVRTYQMAGIWGDANHGYGYHLAPSRLRSSDYSLQTKRDRAGAKKYPNQASAWDLHFSQSGMKVVTARLLAAAKAHDPRMKGVREFCGTLDGRVTYPWDLATNSSEGIDSWDHSHLTHVHISFYRDATDAQILAVVDVILGKKMTVPAKTVAVISKGTAKVTKPKWHLAAGNYYGLITGPNESHGGWNATERAAVKLIQQRLQKLGYAPKTPGWADGKFEKPTADAVKKWQKAKKRPATGRITASDWKVLF